MRPASVERGRLAVTTHRIFRVRYSQFAYTRHGVRHSARVVTVSVSARSAADAVAIAKRVYPRGEGHRAL